MTDLNERLQGIDRLTPPDLWTTAQIKADGSMDGMRSPNPTPARRLAIIATSLAIGLAAVAWVVIAIRPEIRRGTPAAQPILSPAPRTDCRTGLAGGDSVDTQQFTRLMQGYLPTWLPESFGLLATFGWDGAMDGSAAHGIWSDERCREVELDFNPNWRSSGRVVNGHDGPLGPWSLVVVDEADECGNAVLETGRCLRYAASTTNGVLTLATIGLDRDEGDRIALSIFAGDEPSVAPDLSPPATGSSSAFQMSCDDLRATVSGPQAEASTDGLHVMVEGGRRDIAFVLLRSLSTRLEPRHIWWLGREDLGEERVVQVPPGRVQLICLGPGDDIIPPPERTASTTFQLTSKSFVPYELSCDDLARVRPGDYRQDWVDIDNFLRQHVEAATPLLWHLPAGYPDAPRQHWWIVGHKGRTLAALLFTDGGKLLRGKACVGAEISLSP